MTSLILLEKVYAQASDIVGTINPGNAFKPYGDVTTQGAGFVLFFTNILRLFFVAAGIFALFNFIIAGYQYMNSGGDSKALTAAWNRIWLSLLGLIIIVGSFALIAFFSWLIFGNPMFILNPKVYGPDLHEFNPNR